MDEKVGLCTIAECNNLLFSSGLCEKHYKSKYYSIQKETKENYKKLVDLSDEELILLAQSDSENKITDNVELDNVEQFAMSIGLKRGLAKINKNTLYILYTKYSREPKTFRKFINRINSILYSSKREQEYYSVNSSSFKQWIDDGTLIPKDGWLLYVKEESEKLYTGSLSKRKIRKS